MSYSLDANILLYASDENSPYQKRALNFLTRCSEDPDLLYLTWGTLMAYQRIATHPGIFQNPLAPNEAWHNVEYLLDLPRVRVVTENEDFPRDYREVTAAFPVRGNLVPDAHLASILRQQGVKRLYTTDTDFRKFDFLEVINPFSVLAKR